MGRLILLSRVAPDSPGGLAGHSAALIGLSRCGTHPVSEEARRASDLGHAEIVGSEPTPGTSSVQRCLGTRKKTIVV